MAEMAERCRIARAVALSAFCALLVQCATHTDGTAVQEVMRLERRWLDAYEERDAAAMRDILTDGFTITYANGAVQTRDDVLRFIEKSKASGNAAPRFHTEETAARAYGRAVILTGRVVTERVSDGTLFHTAERYTDTYVFTKGRWQVAASHLSSLP
jgi:ketosteroid isomerase-like protein